MPRVHVTKAKVNFTVICTLFFFNFFPRLCIAHLSGDIQLGKIPIVTSKICVCVCETLRDGKCSLRIIYFLCNLAFICVVSMLLMIVQNSHLYLFNEIKLHSTCYSNHHLFFFCFSPFLFFLARSRRLVRMGAAACCISCLFFCVFPIVVLCFWYIINLQTTLEKTALGKTAVQLYY